MVRFRRIETKNRPEAAPQDLCGVPVKWVIKGDTQEEIKHQLNQVPGVTVTELKPPKHKIFHGGCIGCTRQERWYRTSLCHLCQYKSNRFWWGSRWDLPDLSTKRSKEPTHD